MNSTNLGALGIFFFAMYVIISILVPEGFMGITFEGRLGIAGLLTILVGFMSSRKE